VDRTEHDEVVAAFVAAAAGGDLSALLRTLDPAVVLTSDCGGVVSAARRPVVGPDRVARFVLGTARKQEGRVVHVDVNGVTGLAVLDDDDRLRIVISLTVDDGKVRRVDLVLAPDKLTSDIRVP
jgi:RNA polymerase sigma-70 factor, ECF subfamily